MRGGDGWGVVAVVVVAASAAEVVVGGGQGHKRGRREAEIGEDFVGLGRRGVIVVGVVVGRLVVIVVGEWLEVCEGRYFGERCTG